jgi:hypothetical protein
MLLPVTQRYLTVALAGTPDVLEALLKDRTSDDPLWDFRPDPDRFTLREAVAHLADWEPIFLERFQRTLRETEPLLPDYDEGQIAIERDYAHSDPRANLARFRTGREALTAFLRSLEAADWERIGIREPYGPMTLGTQATQTLAHDGYHTQQVAQWLAAFLHA